MRSCPPSSPTLPSLLELPGEAEGGDPAAASTTVPLAVGKGADQALAAAVVGLSVESQGMDAEEDALPAPDAGAASAAVTEIEAFDMWSSGTVGGRRGKDCFTLVSGSGDFLRISALRMGCC